MYQGGGDAYRLHQVQDQMMEEGHLDIHAAGWVELIPWVEVLLPHQWLEVDEEGKCLFFETGSWICTFAHKAEQYTRMKTKAQKPT